MPCWNASSACEIGGASLQEGLRAAQAHRPHLLPAEHCGCAKVVPHVTDGIIPDVVRLKVLRSLKQLPIQPHVGCSGGGRHRLIDAGESAGSAETDSAGAKPADVSTRLLSISNTLEYLDTVLV